MFLRGARQRGDTIVEVLIAIAIVSLTLSGAYASANRSANATRSAQERGEALKWAETQVEQIKAYTGSLPASGSFCMVSEGSDIKASTDLDKCASTDPVPYKATVTQNPAGNFSIVVTWDALDSGVGTNKVELGYKK